MHDLRSPDQGRSDLTDETAGARSSKRYSRHHRNDAHGPSMLIDHGNAGIHLAYMPLLPSSSDRGPSHWVLTCD